MKSAVSKYSFRKIFQRAFLDTLPVMMGYLSMGTAFGVLLVTQVKAANPLWAFGMSLTTISGSMQFAAVEMLANSVKYSLGLVVLLTILINIRYAMYGVSFVRIFKAYPWYVRAYLTIALTDETYAIESRCTCRGRVRRTYFLLVSSLDHAYWVIGTVFGAAAGKLITFDTTGIDFAMTALFLVILVDLCREKSNLIPSLVGGASTFAVLVLFVIFFPAHVNKMLLPAMILMVFFLLLIHRYSGEETTEEGRGK